MKITKDTTLSEILIIPDAKEILAKYNVPCLSCPFAEQEMESLKIGEICETYGIDMGKLIEDLNNATAVDKKR